MVYVLMWVFAGVLPFFPLGGATKGTLIAADLVVAEIVGLLGIGLVGKEAYLALKARFLRGSRRRRE